MSGSIAKSVFPLSDLFFHQKIMNKYQKGIGSAFSFPLMIFSRNITPLKIFMDIHMRFSFHEQNKLFHIISENAISFKNMFSWFNIKKFIPLFKIKSTLLKSAENLHKPVKLIQPELISSLFPPIHYSINAKTNILGSGFVEAENTKFSASVVYFSRNNVVDSFNLQQVFNRQSYLSWMRTDSTDSPLQKSPGSIILSQNVSYPQTIDNSTQQDGRTFNNSFLNHTNYTILKPQIFLLNNKFHQENGTNDSIPYKNENVWQFQSNFESGLSSTFIQPPGSMYKRTVEMRNDTLYNTYQNWTRLDKLLVRNINYNLEAGIVKSLISKRNTYSEIDNENLIFQNQQHIEQKIDQIKKIVDDAQKTMEESMSDNFSGGKNSELQIDINNLSDQVYHTIERRIRIEKERKGI